jgi:uncharacterized protein YndB with AHSA1/START domain
MIRTHGEAVIPAPPEGVFALLTDPVRAQELTRYPVEIVSREGMTAHIRMQMPSGATVDVENVIEERVPNERIVVRSGIHPFGFAPTRHGRFGTVVTRAERNLAPHPGGTLVTVDAEIRITPLLLRLYFAVVKRDQWQRALDEGLARLGAAFA